MSRWAMFLLREAEIEDGLYVGEVQSVRGQCNVGISTTTLVLFEEIDSKSPENFSSKVWTFRSKVIWGLSVIKKAPALRESEVDTAWDFFFSRGKTARTRNETVRCFKSLELRIILYEGRYKKDQKNPFFFSLLHHLSLFLPRSICHSTPLTISHSPFAKTFLRFILLPRCYSTLSSSLFSPLLSSWLLQCWLVKIR